jgi:hypothetical protein
MAIIKFIKYENIDRSIFKKNQHEIISKHHKNCYLTNFSAV